MFNHLKGDTQPPPLLPPFQLVHAESVMQPEVIKNDIVFITFQRIAYTHGRLLQLCVHKCVPQ